MMHLNGVPGVLLNGTLGALLDSVPVAGADDLLDDALDVY